MSETQISRRSTITLGLVIGLIAFITVLSFRFGTEFEKAAGEREAIRRDVTEIHRQLADREADRWRRSDARIYHDTIDRINPDVDIPPVPPGAAGR